MGGRGCERSDLSITLLAKRVHSEIESCISTALNISFSSSSGSVICSAILVSNSVRVLLLLSSCLTEVIRTVSCGSSTVETVPFR